MTANLILLNTSPALPFFFFLNLHIHNNHQRILPLISSFPGNSHYSKEKTNHFLTKLFYSPEFIFKWCVYIYRVVNGRKFYNRMNIRFTALITSTSKYFKYGSMRCFRSSVPTLGYSIGLTCTE